LRNRFVLVLLAIAILPLLLVITSLAQRTFNDLETQSITLQRQVASGIGSRVEATISARVGDLAVLDDVTGIATLNRDDQRTTLRNLLAHQPMYQALAVVDAGGREQIRLARDHVVLDSELRDWAGHEMFVHLTQRRTTYFGPVTFDEVVREPLTTIAYPMVDRRTGELDSVLLATITFKPIWELLARLDLPNTRDAYVLSDDGKVVAHKNPAVVLRGTMYTVPVLDGRAVGLSGEQSVVATHIVRMGGRTLTVVAEERLSSALQVANRALRVTSIVTLLALLAVTAAALFVTRRIVRPVEALSESARQITAGDFSHRAAVTTDDEIGDLAAAFNQMTVQLNEMIETLEQRVAERTSELAGAASTQRSLISELESQNEQMATVQEQLEELMRSKDEFLGSVSHELRTPLACVVGFAAELRDRYQTFSDTERQELIGLLADQGQDMSNIIEDLLVAARSDIGALVVEPTHIDINADVHSVVDSVVDPRVRIHSPEWPVFAFADGVRVRQILRNLLVNARRYGGENIEISVEGSGDVIIVQVRDSGEGIPADDRDTVFEAYQTANDGRANPASVGLGLTISRTLARSMQGDLSYFYEDGWSIFELTLPARDESRPLDTDADTRAVLAG
jgi:signal transduction histidine kinase